MWLPGYVLDTECGCQVTSCIRNVVARLRPGYGMWLPGYVLDMGCGCFSFKVIIKYEAISLILNRGLVRLSKVS